MKSIFITFLMFAVALAAVHIGLFDVMSSSYITYTAILLVIVSVIFALKVLGNPLAKDEKNDQNKI